MSTLRTHSVVDDLCPSRSALEVIGSKWTLIIVPLLSKGDMRNGELMRRIEGISQKMLTQTLRELERNGLVERADLESIPPHVVYALTAAGRALSEALEPLDAWVIKHRDKLVAAREHFDAQ